jgi:sugar (pentulose or hexulose) kinase
VRPRDPQVLAIDVGTSGVRVSVVDLRGTLRAVKSTALRPGPELPVEEVWQAVGALVRSATEDAGPVRGVGCAGQLALVAVDGRGRPLGPALTWMDTRARAEAEELERRVGREVYLRRCGRRPHPEQLAPRVLWMATHAREVLDRAAAFLPLKDYLVLRMTGEMGTDYVDASYTLLCDVGALRWADDLAEAAGVRRALLPPLRWPHEVAGRLRGEVARELGLSAGIPVVAGGPDGTMGLVALGLCDPGDAADTAGTSDVIGAVVDRPAIDPRGDLITNAYVVEGLWTLGGPTTTTGGVLEWLARTLAGSEGAVPSLIEEAAGIGPGAGGVVVLPDLIGGRAPHWTPATRGAVCGLGLHHTRAHVVRAALEATAYLEREILDRIGDVAGPVRRVRLGGGGGTHPVGVRIRADVTGVPHLVSAERHITSVGVAVMTAVGTGDFPSVQEAMARMVPPLRVCPPDPAACDLYRPSFQAYRAVREALGGVWGAAAGQEGVR